MSDNLKRKMKMLKSHSYHGWHPLALGCKKSHQMEPAHQDIPFTGMFVLNGNINVVVVLLLLFMSSLQLTALITNMISRLD